MGDSYNSKMKEMPEPCPQCQLQGVMVSKWHVYDRTLVSKSSSVSDGGLWMAYDHKQSLPKLLKELVWHTRDISIGFTILETNVSDSQPLFKKKAILIGIYRLSYSEGNYGAFLCVLVLLLHGQLSFVIFKLEILKLN